MKLVLSRNGTAHFTFVAHTALCCRFEMASLWRNTFVQTSGHSGACGRTGVANCFARTCFHHNMFVLTNSLANFKNFLYPLFQLIKNWNL